MDEMRGKKNVFPLSFALQSIAAAVDIGYERDFVTLLFQEPD
jgi:hypothetical protein